ncbi:hypothetical protein Dsin_025018 [Dipteronia sinensis]|uniref:Uncharacterized protein n=1 Tax=Dipteronia sinensis TaxID=43782 RepID=A0AAD9ZWJ0_9ROSI|nr:hypothetical protein Dsin_025018 [Dipteronia sinensis]
MPLSNHKQPNIIHVSTAATPIVETFIKANTDFQRRTHHRPQHLTFGGYLVMEIAPEQISRSSRGISSIQNRSISPNRSISIWKKNNPISFQKKSCMCSPTTHLDSFLCSLHKNTSGGGDNHGHGTVPYAPNRLNMRRSAMTNSLVRI